MTNDVLKFTTNEIFYRQCFLNISTSKEVLNIMNSIHLGMKYLQLDVQIKSFQFHNYIALLDKIRSIT